MFYLPGCLFFADWKEKRREKRYRGSAFAAGARSPRARPARGGVSRRPPSAAGAGPAAAPPAALPRAPAPFAAAPPRAARAPTGYQPRRRPSPCARGSVGPSARRTPLGTHSLLPLLPQLHRQPRSGPSPGPAPFTRPAAPRPAQRGEKAAASARGTAPGPAPSHHPFPTPPTPGEGLPLWGTALGLRAPLVAPHPHVRVANATREPGRSWRGGRAALKVNRGGSRAHYPATDRMHRPFPKPSKGPRSLQEGGRERVPCLGNINKALCRRLESAHDPHTALHAETKFPRLCDSNWTLEEVWILTSAPPLPRCLSPPSYLTALCLSFPPPVI